MLIRNDPALLDAAVSALIQEREASGDLRFTREYHALTDAAYGVAPSAREEAFQQIHQRLYRQWHLAAPLEAILAEFPTLQEQVLTLWVVRAPTSRDEGADLGFPGRTAAIVRLLPRRFLDPPGLGRLLRHELTHLADMLDPTFEYQPTVEIPGTLPAEEPLVRDRYRLLWDITIDSRLVQAERETVASREQRRTAFDAQFHGVPTPILEGTFGRLWQMARPSHPALLEMAVDPGRALFEAWTGTIRSLPGSRCPLCRFPSQSLLQGTAEVPAVVVDGIRQDFPSWRPELGACERCVEGYAVSQGAV